MFFFDIFAFINGFHVQYIQSRLIFRGSPKASLSPCELMGTDFLFGLNIAWSKPKR